jgi:P-type Ca2+ transporter type 2C
MKIKYPIQHPYTHSVEYIVQLFQTDAIAGITTSEAGKRTKIFGLNVYLTQKPKPIWLMLLQQFNSPIVYLLVFGGGISIYFQDYIEAIAIGVVILVNAIIGFSMELQARSSMNALKEMDVILSKVIRNGKVQNIPSEQLTVGDLVSLEAGDVVPGDGRLVEFNQLQCDESSLTGESLPSSKNIEILEKDTALGDRHNMVFKGTSVINGNGKAVITGIAQNTELGTITALVENAEESLTPLDKKLNHLSKKLIWLTLILTTIFTITGFLQGKESFSLIKTSIALAIAAFPEGLPIVSTVALSYGMLHMAKRHVIVKDLSSVETLGSTTVILTDKTGTLTENKIYVDTFSFPEENIKVHIEKDTLIFDEGEIKHSKENFEKLKLIGALCNNTSVKATKEKKKILGDPVEIALIHLADTSGTSAEDFKTQYERIAEVPFNSDIKIMGTLHKYIKNMERSDTPNALNTEGVHFVAAKGSVEHLLEKCKQTQSGVTIKELNEADRKTIIAESEKMAANGLRVLAFGYREAENIQEEDFLKDLVYVGMIGFLDPPRLDIKHAILSCKNAGIQVVMITGDHPLTALNIAQKTGLIEENEQNVINGKDLPPIKSMTPAWKKKILSTAVFARTTPKQKLEIAGIFQKANNIVAMTGDGVNDAPALKKADVGIAMGLRGTQVAKETANIVVKDDSFASIVKAVAQGRVIFQNIQKFVIYLVSCNLSEIFVVMTIGFVMPDATLLPLQILFLNMVTDVFPALALGLGKGDKTVMERQPKDPKNDIISNRKWLDIVLYAMIITLSVMTAVIYCQQNITPNNEVANSVAFITLAFAQLFHVFNMSSPHAKLFINDITKNKFIWLAILICTAFMVLVYAVPQIHLILGLADLSIEIWGVCIAASLLPLLLGQIYKKNFER